MRRAKPKILHPEGRQSYAVEAWFTPKGLYVGRQFASHGSLIRWAVMKAALRRARRKGLTS